MIKYALCIESIFPGMDYSERIQHTIDTGFNAVEVWGVDDAKKKGMDLFLRKLPAFQPGFY